MSATMNRWLSRKTTSELIAAMEKVTPGGVFASAIVTELWNRDDVEAISYFAGNKVIGGSR